MTKLMNRKKIVRDRENMKKIFEKKFAIVGAELGPTNMLNWKTRAITDTYLVRALIYTRIHIKVSNIRSKVMSGGSIGEPSVWES